MRIKISLSLILILQAFSVFPQKTDPYFTDSGGFGRILTDNDLITLWWCEGAYKLMKDTPPPKIRSNTIRLKAAGNEYEPFQLIFKAADTLRNLYISIDNLTGPGGEISADNFGLRLVDYVRISKPTDSYAYPGYWPDPLPLLNDSIELYPGENTTIWFNLYIPPLSKAGNYNTLIRLRSDTWTAEIPLTVKVWDFSLPESSSIRSGFGLSVDKIADYHNISDSTDLALTFDMYMQAFRDYKISPYSFYYLSQINTHTEGVYWKGAYYDSEVKYDGKYSLRAEDNSFTADPGIVYKRLIEVNGVADYTLSWTSMSSYKDQQFTVVVEGFNSGDSLLLFETKADAFYSDTIWKTGRYRIGKFGEDVTKIRLSLYPVFRTGSGENTGIIWFDNLGLKASSADLNLLEGGDFEINTDSINVKLDFSAFDRAAERYLDEFGFNAFRLNLEGMGSGTYFSRNEGIFEGFKSGTPEYNRLMSQYLVQIQDHLSEKGWLGKEYIYWFDEPGEKDYPFVRDGMELIKGSAPNLTTFLTENEPGPEIMDVTDITCTILNRVDTAKVREVTRNGGQYWSYICTGPRSPWISEFIDHDAINLRMWLWMSYAYHLDGILIWSTNYWTSRSASEPGYLQNPWTEAASYVQGYGWPLGKQTSWGNGDGRFWYPPNRNPNTDKRTYIEGPVPSIRLEFLRQGIEDYEYLVMLESLIKENPNLGKNLVKRANELLAIPGEIFTDGKTYTKNPALLYDHRQKVAELIERINKSLNPLP